MPDAAALRERVSATLKVREMLFVRHARDVLTHGELGTAVWCGRLDFVCHFIAS